MDESNSIKIFKPLTTYTKIIRKILSHNPYREHLRKSSCEQLLDLCKAGVFQSSLIRRSCVLNSQELGDLSRVFMFLCINNGHQSSEEACHLLELICDYLSNSPIENSCHMFLLLSLNHIIWENFDESPARITKLVDSCISNLISLYERLQTAREQSRKSLLRHSIFQIFRFYISTAALACENDRYDLRKCLSMDNIHSLTEMFYNDIQLRKQTSSCPSYTRFIEVLTSGIQLRQGILYFQKGLFVLGESEVDKFDCAELSTWSWLDAFTVSDFFYLL
jgi:hypothetical protein